MHQCKMCNLTYGVLLVTCLDMAVWQDSRYIKANYYPTKVVAAYVVQFVCNILCNPWT